MKSLFHRKTIITSVVMVFCFLPLYAQEFSFAANGSVTTSSRLFFNPYDPDEVSRNQALDLRGVWGIGIDIRHAVKGKILFVGISAEYLWANERLNIQENNNISVTAEDGYIAIPVEATGYFSIPFGTESFRMYMGGGFGIYFGERHYYYADFKSQIVERTPGFGIHVVSGFEFDITSSLAIRSELKFRDVQFESTNTFPQKRYVGESALPGNGLPFNSRISIDGILLNLGVAFRY